MRILTGATPARSPQRVIALVAAAVVAATAAPSDAAAGQAPTLRAVTTLAGSAAPEPFVSGAWTSSGGMWSTTLKSASPPAGRTTVSSSWVSPKASARRGARFAMKAHVWHQSALGSYGHSAQARACWTGGCGSWITNASDDVPPVVSIETLPWRVEYEYAISIHVRPSRGSVWFEWRYRQFQEGTSVGETVVQLAAGDAARSLR